MLRLRRYRGIMNFSSSWSPRVASVALLIAVGLGLGATGCSSLASLTATGVGGAQAPAAAWSCALDITYNEDWHDDVLCTDGTSFDRPRLRPDDAFLTEEEIAASAAEYEAQLNAAF